MESQTINKVPDLSGFSKRQVDAAQYWQAIRRHDGNLKLVAQELGVSLKTVYRWRDIVILTKSSN